MTLRNHALFCILTFFLALAVFASTGRSCGVASCDSSAPPRDSCSAAAPDEDFLGTPCAAQLHTVCCSAKRLSPAGQQVRRAPEQRSAKSALAKPEAAFWAVPHLPNRWVSAASLRAGTYGALPRFLRNSAILC